jgi:hypothetical protein
VSLLPLGGFSLLGPVRGPNRRTSCFHLAFQPRFRNAAPPTSGISPRVSPFARWWYYPLCGADPLLGFPTHEHPSGSHGWPVPRDLNRDCPAPTEAGAFSSPSRPRGWCDLPRGLLAKSAWRATTQPTSTQCLPQMVILGRAKADAPSRNAGSSVTERFRGSLRSPVGTRQPKPSDVLSAWYAIELPWPKP